MLVDSGRHWNFISSQAVQLLKLKTVSVPEVIVVVADGGKTTVNTAVQEVNWECHGAEFCKTFRVFDLQHYDMILGLEWLDTLGPMRVDWGKRTFRIKQGDKRLTLRGVKNKISECHIIIAEDMCYLVHENDVAQLVYLCPVRQGGEEGEIPAEI